MALSIEEEDQVARYFFGGMVFFLGFTMAAIIKSQDHDFSLRVDQDRWRARKKMDVFLPRPPPDVEMAMQRAKASMLRANPMRRLFRLDAVTDLPKDKWP